MPPLESGIIVVVVIEHPTILTSEITTITPANRACIDKIIQVASEATQIRKAKTAEKAAKQSSLDRQMETILLAMLESPSGVTKADILIAGETDDFIATINKFRAYLRRNNVYTLKKRTKDKKPLYVLDPMR